MEFKISINKNKYKKQQPLTKMSLRSSQDKKTERCGILVLKSVLNTKQHFIPIADQNSSFSSDNY